MTPGDPKHLLRLSLEVASREKNNVGGFKNALRGFSVEAPQTVWGPFLGDSVRILRVCLAVTLTFGP